MDQRLGNCTNSVEYEEPPQHEPTRASLASSSHEATEEICNVDITPEMIAKVKGITKSISRLERLDKRRQDASFRRINTEHKLANLLYELEKRAGNSVDEKLPSEDLEKLETAYRTACTKEARLLAAISAEESNIQTSRDDLEWALRGILQSLGVLHDDDGGGGETEASQDSSDDMNEHADDHHSFDTPTASSVHEPNPEEQ